MDSLNYTSQRRNPLFPNILLLSILICIIFVCTRIRNISPCSSPPSETSSKKRLNISAVTDETAGLTTFNPDYLGNGYKEDLVYYNLTNVEIEINGTNFPLEDALRDELITIEEMIAYARIDARNEICTQSYNTYNGLTHFTYHYPEFYLCVTNDIYSTPDGKHHLIEDIILSSIPTPDASSRFYLDKDSEYGYWIDREDWGLIFEISEVSSTQIILQYNQSEGQQIGKLIVDSYDMLSVETLSDVKKKASYINAVNDSPEKLDMPIISEGSYAISVDWSETYGTLAPGDYYLKLNISDVYEEKDVHPLMVNYYDRQSYYVAFTIE